MEAEQRARASPMRYGRGLVQAHLAGNQLRRCDNNATRAPVKRLEPSRLSAPR